jgi:hypothetical protein
VSERRGRGRGVGEGRATETDGVVARADETATRRMDGGEGSPKETRAPGACRARRARCDGSPILSGGSTSRAACACVRDARRVRRV